MLRAISLWQPWASLWVAGIKPDETRSWATHHRGPLVVHASKKWDRDAEAFCRLPEVQDALRHVPGFQAGASPRSYLPLGAYIGAVWLTGCPWTEYVRGTLTHAQRVLGNYANGRRAWTTTLQRWALVNPIPAAGHQRLWHIEPAAEEIIRRLMGLEGKA